MSTLQILLRHGRGAIVAVEGDGLAMRFGGDSSRPPLFSIKKVFFTVDLGVLFEPKKSVTFVSLEGMEINIPPKGERQNLARGGGGSNSNVIIQNVQIHDAVLVLLPKDAGRKPLRIQHRAVAFAIGGRELRHAIRRRPDHSKAAGNGKKHWQFRSVECLRAGRHAAPR